MSLNETVWVTLAPSKIHGIGVFAIRDIPKETKMYCLSVDREWMFGLPKDTLPEIKELILSRYPRAEEQYQGFVHPNDDVRYISFMNHSDDPNYDNETDKSLRDIKKGEEITENYGECAEDW